MAYDESNGHVRDDVGVWWLPME